ncbi:hypothetical protein SAMN05444143_101623 [Flavobacterium succinicans]|uniref:Uncharacterized protein n=1 Tax=Flavobacterium succinicans TaxID=29536 RepID=A0A1I4S1I8_9FLAO|nr:hypothetical protein SAMN05444143_101623 [Flavobacterium succinicans]
MANSHATISPLSQFTKLESMTKTNPTRPQNNLNSCGVLNLKSQIVNPKSAIFYIFILLKMDICNLLE